MHPLEEHAAFGALDDPVVVRRGDVHRPPDTGGCDRRRIGSLILRRVADRPDADDHALPGHEAWHRLHRAHRARIRQRGGGAGKVVGSDLAGADPRDDVFICLPVGLEVHLFDRLDVGHEQCAGPVLALDVHRQTQVDVFVDNVMWDTFDGGVGHIHRRAALEGFDRRPTDEMGERDFGAFIEPEQLIVDHPAVDLEQLGGQRTHRCGRRQLAALVHSFGDEGAGAGHRGHLGQIAVDLALEVLRNFELAPVFGLRTLEAGDAAGGKEPAPFGAQRLRR